MNEFKHRESLSLFTSNSWICFCSIISWVKFENSRISILLYLSTITFDAQSKTKTKSFAKLVFRCQKFEFANFCWFQIHSNTKYLFIVWFETHSNTRYLLFVLIWFQHFCSIASKWFDFCIFVWSHRNDLIWKIIIVVIFAFDKLELFETNCLNKSFSSQNFCCRNDNWWRNRSSCLFKFRWYYDQKFLFCSERRFSRERFSRIELLQNKYFQKHFKSTFRRRWKFDCFDTFFMWNTWYNSLLL